MKTQQAEKKAMRCPRCHCTMNVSRYRTTRGYPCRYASCDRCGATYCEAGHPLRANHPGSVWAEIKNPDLGSEWSRICVRDDCGTYQNTWLRLRDLLWDGRSAELHRLVEHLSTLPKSDPRHRALLDRGDGRTWGWSGVNPLSAPVGMVTVPR